MNLTQTTDQTHCLICGELLTRYEYAYNGRTYDQWFALPTDVNAEYLGTCEHEIA